ncbi:hypothetical protein [Vibrio zhanjiangensis]|uniref:hypothetical protein n=1 Tax=Vibrio zhanjiangensis TaxID=1046128 RepID=UPI0024E04203|nr:hypothetical protein [Vibrio zhanjiangensis]
MEKINLFLGIICCCIGVIICFYGINELILDNVSWPFILVVGISTTLLGISIVGLNTHYTWPKQKKNSS